MEYIDGIIPDIIDKGPEEICQVIYPNNQSIFWGNLMIVSQVEEQPKVIWEAEETAFYTLLMIDPDAPEREDPNLRSWLHWLVGNIPGGDISKGKVIVEYVGCKPPTCLNLHRYIFLVYKQDGNISFDEEVVTKRCMDGRTCFSVKKFAEKYNLGSTIAGNFFTIGYDHQVLPLYVLS